MRYAGSIHAVIEPRQIVAKVSIVSIAANTSSFIGAMEAT